MAKKITHKRETRLRSFLKSISFRIIVVLSDSAVVALVTGNAPVALWIVLFTNISSTILYYLHERIWNMTTWKKVSRNRPAGEHITRSLAKAVSFRIVVLTSDLLITNAITGNTSATIEIIIITNLFSTLLYFLHERIWNNSSWGLI